MSLSSGQLLELIVVLTNVYRFLYAVSVVRSASTHARSKSGPVRPDTVPYSYTLLTPLQPIVCFLIPAVYISTVVGAGFRQPLWMNAFALPEMAWQNALRVLACAASLALSSISNSAFKHLGDQYHPIGRREKPRVVQTGPYAWVRHPLYTLAVSQPVLWSLMFWSYAPLFAIVATAVVFGLKICIEEEAIQRDDAMREEYRAYMRKVPTRLIPYIW